MWHQEGVIEGQMSWIDAMSKGSIWILSGLAWIFCGVCCIPLLYTEPDSADCFRERAVWVGLGVFVLILGLWQKKRGE